MVEHIYFLRSPTPSTPSTISTLSPVLPGSLPPLTTLCVRRLLSEIFPRATELYERVAANREQWTKVSHKFTIRGLPSNNSLDFLDQEYELLQSQGAFGSDDHCINGCLDDGEGGQGQ